MHYSSLICRELGCIDGDNSYISFFQDVVLCVSQVSFVANLQTSIIRITVGLIKAPSHMVSAHNQWGRSTYIAMHTPHLHACICKLQDILTCVEDTVSNQGSEVRVFFLHHTRRCYNQMTGGCLVALTPTIIAWSSDRVAAGVTAQQTKILSILQPCCAPDSDTGCLFWLQKTFSTNWFTRSRARW